MTMDGMVMGVRLNHLYLQQPWLPCEADEAVRGCTLATRLLLPDPALLKALVLITSISKGGLAAAKLLQIRSSLQQLQRSKPQALSCSILYLLDSSEPVHPDQDQEDGNETASEGDSGSESGSAVDLRLADSKYLGILRCLASTAPMLQLVPTAIWSLVAALAEGQPLTDALSHEFSRQQSPVLHKFLGAQLLQQTCDTNTRRLLASMLKVCCCLRGRISPLN